VRLIIVGDGPERANLEGLAAELNLSERVKFAGAVPKEELPTYYAAADVFAMVPRSGPDGVEGFGIVYLEANLLEKPVIGSRTGGVPDAIIDGKTGILVDAGDVNGLAEAIRTLNNQPALATSMGRRGRERVLEQFSWRRQVGPLVTALEKYFKPS
jgi:phosphatidylinositol alpha-1,6-mannosyltransferase